MSRHHVDAGLTGRRYLRLRRFVFRRDGYRCVACQRASRLELHHVIPLERGGHPTGLANLQSVCVACHVKIHANMRGKDYSDPERLAWREYLRTMAGVQS